VGIADGMAAVEQIVAAKTDGPLGVFAMTDVLAFGLVQGLQRTGTLQIPSDVRIVGYDGIALSATSVPSISTVRQRAPELGRHAIEMLEALVSGDALRTRDLVLSPDFVERESSRISHL
jgi:LacI family transcriptional regulator